MQQTVKAIARSMLLLVIVVLAATQQPAAQSWQTERVMRQKLAEAQQLLSAVVTSNWTALDQHARALRALTDEPGWNAMRIPQFRDYTVSFQRTIDAVIASSGQRDQRSAVQAYNSLVSSCVECHTYVSRARIAGWR